MAVGDEHMEMIEMDADLDLTDHTGHTDHTDHYPLVDFSLPVPPDTPSTPGGGDGDGDGELGTSALNVSTSDPDRTLFEHDAERPVVNHPPNQPSNQTLAYDLADPAELGPPAARSSSVGTRLDILDLGLGSSVGVGTAVHHHHYESVEAYHAQIKSAPRGRHTKQVGAPHPHHAVAVCCGRVLWPCAVAVCCGRVLRPCAAAVCCSRMLWPCAVAVCCDRVLRPCAAAACCSHMLWPCDVAVCRVRSVIRPPARHGHPHACMSHAWDAVLSSMQERHQSHRHPIWPMCRVLWLVHAVLFLCL